MVGVVEDGEFEGEEEYRRSLEESAVDLDDEEELVRTFDNVYFDARRVKEDE